MVPTRSRASRLAMASVAIAACIAMQVGSPTPARAEDDLQTLQEQAIQAGDAYSQAQTEADEIQTKIDDIQGQIDDIQAKLPEQRQKSASAMRTEYKMQQGQSGLIDLILSSTDFNDFITTMQYVQSLTTFNSNEAQRLADMEQQLQDAQTQLAAEKQAADDKVKAASDAYQTAQTAASAAEAKAAEQAAANQAAAEAAAAAGQSTTDNSTAAVNASYAASPATASPAADTSSSQSSSETQASSSSSSSDSGSSSSSSSSASWTWVEASEYGDGDGCMYSATASGDIVTWTSMGVAMKYMPLGTIIEITYNGNTCRAVVNDRGPYVGNRQIDLQPAVASALGFDGIGTVGYRVVG